MQVAVVGIGAVGGYLAWQVAQRGHDVVLCARSGFDALSVTSGGRTYEVAAQVATTPEGAAAVCPGPVDVLVLATKAHDTAGAAPWLRALAGERTLVVIAQNGIEQEERVRPLAPAATLLPALVYAAGAREAADGSRTTAGIAWSCRPGRAPSASRTCCAARRSTSSRRTTSTPPPGARCCPTSPPTPSPP